MSSPHWLAGHIRNYRATRPREIQCINAYAREGEVVGCRLRCTLLQIYCVTFSRRRWIQKRIKR